VNHTLEVETKAKMGVCMVKTHLSLTDNPVLNGGRAGGSGSATS
jgi:hypothetical protein